MMKSCVGQASWEGMSLHVWQRQSMLLLPHPLGGPRDPGDLEECLVSRSGLCSSQSSRCLLCSADGSCLSVFPAKAKALFLARCLEPASWGQRSPSEASWHPGVMGAGRVSPSGERQEQASPA